MKSFIQKDPTESEISGNKKPKENQYENCFFFRISTSKAWIILKAIKEVFHIR